MCCKMLQIELIYICEEHKMITVSLRFDEKTKKELDDMCDEMGMNITTFFMIYAKKVLRDRCIPFDITAPIGENNGKKEKTSSGKR